MYELKGVNKYGVPFTKTFINILDARFWQAQLARQGIHTQIKRTR